MEVILANNSKNRDPNASRDKAAVRAMEGAKATAQYEAESQAVRDKTARLRALRLAKEAADQSTAAKAPATGKKAAKSGEKKPAKKKKSKADESLSDWLKAEDGAGRRS
jgi:hypothetical protein